MEFHNKTAVQGKSLSVPLSSSGETSPVSGNDRRKPLSRTRSGMPDCSYTTNTVLESQIHQCFNPSQQQNISSNWDSHRKGSELYSLPKSHSIENISRDAYSYNSYSQAWNRQTVPTQQQQQCSTQQIQQHTLQQNQNQQQQHDNDDSANLHRKLRRQLTLNPANCDPRIYQLQMQQQKHAHTQQNNSPHRPLAPTLSGPRSHHPSQWDLHQVYIYIVF